MRGLLQSTSWRRTLGRAILSLTWPASTIWQGTRGIKPWRGCHRFCRRLLRLWPPAQQRDCACPRPKTDVHHWRGGFGQDSSIEDLSCCAGSLEQKPVRFHRTHSWQKLPQQPHTRDGTTNRGTKCRTNAAGPEFLRSPACSRSGTGRNPSPPAGAAWQVVLAAALPDPDPRHPPWQQSMRLLPRQGRSPTTCTWSGALRLPLFVICGDVGDKIALPSVLLQDMLCNSPLA